jgi:Asp-tRNA(Asn)/Glu-tRNA(Gln) amidotransferase A subunit family amidase
MKCVSWHLDTAGLFAASVADVAFAAAAISDRDLRVDGRTPSSPRIGVLRDQPWAAASDDMKAAIEHIARAASAANARVRDIKLAPVLASAFRAHGTIQAYEAARSLASTSASRTSSPRACWSWSRAALRSAPTPMMTPAATRARRAARCST